MVWLFEVWVFGLIECSYSLPALHGGLQIIIILMELYRSKRNMGIEVYTAMNLAQSCCFNVEPIL